MTTKEAHKVVDAHVHLGESIYGERLDVDKLLAQMDRHGIDISIVAAFTPPDLDFAQANRRVAEAVRAHPDRLIGATRADPRLGKISLDEIRRASGTYGFRGLTLHPGEQGFQVNNPLVLPCVELAEELGLFVHIPTGYPVFSTPLQVAAIARKFPSVRFLMGHMGLNAYLYDALKALTFYPNLHVETAGHVVTGELKNGVHMAVEAVGAKRVIFASDAPYFDVGVERLKIEVANLSSGDQQLVLGASMLRLLGQSVVAP